MGGDHNACAAALQTSPNEGPTFKIMSYLYTDTIPHMPRSASKRSIQRQMDHVKKLEEKARSEKQARQKAERDLRVLRRVRFRLDDQTASVCASLKLINHVSP